ncbi:MAG: class I SAM-dependent methyltransferase [Planctomycetes bacterium]|nr:class I SAM-dependent methyltransferase [Planctomycetota bacterium]
MDDIARLRDEYKDRKGRFAGSNLYSWFNQANLFALHQRQRSILAALKKNKFTALSSLSILEMGCGGGGVLTEYLGFGALPEKLHGVDLLFDRLLHAHHTLPSSGFANADGQSLPFPSQTFDLVLQSTAISSILDPDLRRNICADMLRVLRSPAPASGKPGGMILSYDFWLNPTNPQTRGVRPAEIKQLFPNCQYEFHRITLAPPIARKLAPISWGLCLFLESLKILNTHYLVAIRPKSED